MSKPLPKPCPLCGNRSSYGVEIITRRLFEKKYYRECKYCHFCSSPAYTKRGAVRLWNLSTNIVRIEEAQK